MPGFQFRLATVMKLRQRLRDEQRTELAMAFEAETVLRETNSEINAQLEGVRNVVRELLSGGSLDVDKLLSAKRHDVELRTRQHELQQHARQLEAEIERRRAALVEADRDVRVLEKLREKQRAKFNADQQKRENRLLDEINSHRFESEDKVPPWAN